MFRNFINVPVLPIPRSGMTVFSSAGQMGLLQSLSRSSTALATKKATAGVTLMQTLSLGVLTLAQEAAVVAMTFFFPLDAAAAAIIRCRPTTEQKAQVPVVFVLSPGQREALAARLTFPGTLAVVDSAAHANAEEAEKNLHDVEQEDVGGGYDDPEEDDGTADDGADAEFASSSDVADGGSYGQGPVPRTQELGRGRRGSKKDKAATNPWAQLKVTFAPCFDIIEVKDVPAWTSIRWVLRATLGQLVVNLLVSCDRDEFKKLIMELRAPDPKAWRSETKAVDHVAFLSHFLSRVAPALDSFRSLRLAIATIFGFCLQVEKDLNDMFASAADKYTKLCKGANKDYCEIKQDTSPERFEEYARSIVMERLIDDGANASMEIFPLLRRYGPAIWDRTAATRRIADALGQKRGRTSASAAEEDLSDNCNKIFSNDSRMTPGVYNVLCPHVISYGFRVLTKAESVEDGISAVLERFPVPLKTIYYDKACNMNRNLLRRVRPLFRHFRVR